MKSVSVITILLPLVIAPSGARAQAFDSTWTIRSGTYAAVTLRLDRSAATRHGSQFFRVSHLKGDSRIVGWNPSRLPALVAFRTASRIDATDSAAFWAILRRMEEDMGMRLFEPAGLTSDPDPGDVIVVDLKRMAGDDGVTLVTWSNSGALYDARVYFRSPATLHNSRVVTHEMMHALGFGHTSAWKSVMSPDGDGPDRLTAEDVAYAQFGFNSRAASERTDMWERLALALEREPVARDLRDGYSVCPSVSDLTDGESIMRTRGLAVLGVVTAVSACERR